MIKKNINRMDMLIRKLNPIGYARHLGVDIDGTSRLVDNPNWGSEPYLISIGQHVLISCKVLFVNHDGATWLFRDTEEYKGVFKYGRIRIDDNCFIGCGVTILLNVHIRSNSILLQAAWSIKVSPPEKCVGGYQPILS